MVLLVWVVRSGVSPCDDVFVLYNTTIQFVENLYSRDIFMSSFSCSYFCIMVTIADGLLSDQRKKINPSYVIRCHGPKMELFIPFLKFIRWKKKCNVFSLKVLDKKGFGPTFWHSGFHLHHIWDSRQIVQFIKLWTEINSWLNWFSQITVWHSTSHSSSQKYKHSATLHIKSSLYHLYSCTLILDNPGALYSKQERDNSGEHSNKNNIHGNHCLSQLENQNNKFLRMNFNIVKSKFSISVSSKLVCILKVWKWRMKYVVAFLNFYLHWQSKFLTKILYKAISIKLKILKCSWS